MASATSDFVSTGTKALFSGTAQQDVWMSGSSASTDKPEQSRAARAGDFKESLIGIDQRSMELSRLSDELGVLQAEAEQIQSRGQTIPLRLANEITRLVVAAKATATIAVTAGAPAKRSKAE